MVNSKIPPEDLERIKAFEAEELAKMSTKTNQRETKKLRQLRERVTSGTVFKPEELITYATQQGWNLLGTEGSHHKFEHAETGDILIIPSRGGQQQTIQPDTARRILGKLFPDWF